METSLQLLKEAAEQITAAHRAFGAPGDHGYETPEGIALFGLYKLHARIADVIREPVSADARTIHEVLSKADVEYSAISCNGVNLFGDKKSIDAAVTAFHSHSQIDDLKTNLRHWRDECGKLNAKIASITSVAEASQ